MYEIHFYLKIVKIGNIINKELLGKCEVGKKFAPFWHKGRAERGCVPKGCNFFAPRALSQQLYY